MADVQPLRALHYDPAVVGALGERGGAALRRDRRGTARGAARALAVQRGRGRPAAGRRARRRAAPIPTPRRASCSRAGSCRARWSATRSRRCGRTRRTTRDPTASGAHAAASSAACASRTTAPAACDRTSARIPARRRTGCGSRARRARTSRRSSRSTPTRRTPPGGRSQPATEQTPWGEVTDADGTVHRLWRVSDPEAIAAVQAATARRGAADRRRAPPLRDDAGLRAGDRRRRRAPLHPDVPGRAGGPGADGVPHPSPGRRPRRRAPGGARRRRCARDFEIAEVPLEQITPAPGAGPLQLGYVDGRDGRALRLTLKDQAIADAALPRSLRRPTGTSTPACWRRCC